jgi:hypothetical protein
MNENIHAEEKLFKSYRFNISKKKDEYLTIIRVNYNNQKLNFNLAQPCKHCNKKLKNINKKIYSKYGKQIYIRYSLNNNLGLENYLILTQYQKINYIPEGKISSGYRNKYK